jgi:hypothetical protein
MSAIFGHKIFMVNTEIFKKQTLSVFHNIDHK